MKKEPITQLIAPQVKKSENEARTKIAETFNTNRSYVSEAGRNIKRNNETRPT